LNSSFRKDKKKNTPYNQQALLKEPFQFPVYVISQRNKLPTNKPEKPTVENKHKQKQNYLIQ